MVKYLHDLDYPFPENALTEAIENGAVEIINYLLKYEFQDNNICRKALQCGNARLMKRLHKMGYPVDEKVFEEAIDHGDISLVKYLHESGCPWDENVFRKAVIVGILEIVEYLYENGCPYDEDIVTTAVENENVEELEFFFEEEFHFDIMALIKKTNAGNYRKSRRFLRSLI